MTRRADPARRAAYDVVLAVEQQGAYANLLLPRVLSRAGLAGRDAALATDLAYGTLRRQGTLDLVLAACARRPLERLDPEVRAVLRLGAYALLHTRTAPHAAVATAVDLVAAVSPRGRTVTGLVNAVLRRVAERDADAWLTALAPARADDPVGHLAVTQAHPAWIVAAVRDALGDTSPDLLATEAALAADNAPPQVHLVARPGLVDRAELVAASGGTPGPWSPYAVRLAGGNPAALPAVRDGRAAVQDEGSQLVALALAAAPLDGPDRAWLDLCAGPGGKAALLGAVAAGLGARLTAVEVAPHRADLVRATTRGLPVTVVAGDATDPGVVAGGYDRVLLDAPCTGLGALRRRPEARWRRSAADLTELTALQARLLDAAGRLVRPGGVVAYVTCSPHLAETDAQVAAALDRHPDWAPLDARPLLPGVADLGPGPAVQLWPHRHGTDAMFLAVLRAGDHPPPPS